MKTSILKNITANYFGQFWTALMGVAFIPLYIEYLGIEAYGLVGLFSVMQVWVGLLDMGLVPALGREMARFRAGGHSAQSIRVLLRTIEILAFTIFICVLVVGVPCTKLLAVHWLRVENISLDIVAQTLSIMIFVVALRFLEGIYRSCIVGLQQQVLLNILSSALATLRWLGSVGVLSWIEPTPQAFFIWHGICSIISITLFAFSTYKLLPLGHSQAKFSIVALSKIKRFAGGMLGTSVLVLIITQADKILLSRLLLLSDYGYYTLASTVAGGLYIFISPIAQAYFPVMCQLQERKDQQSMIEVFHTSAQLVSVLAGSASLVVLVFSEDLLNLWTQDSILAKSASSLLSILIFGNLINGLMWMPYQAQLAHGWTSLTVKTNAVAVFFIVPSIFIVAPKYGAIGAAWVWVALNTGYLLISVQFMYRRILRFEMMNWYIKDLLYPLIPAAIIVFVLRNIISISDNIYSQLFSLICVYLLTLVISCMCANKVRKLLYKYYCKRLINLKSSANE